MREKKTEEHHPFNDNFIPIYLFGRSPIFISAKKLMEPLLLYDFEDFNIDLTIRPKFGYFDSNDDEMIVTFEGGTVRFFSLFYGCVELMGQFRDPRLQSAHWGPTNDYLIAEYDDGSVSVNRLYDPIISARMESYVFIDNKYFAFADQKGVHVCNLHNCHEPYLLPLVKEHSNFCGFDSCAYHIHLHNERSE